MPFPEYRNGIFNIMLKQIIFVCPEYVFGNDS